MNKLAVINILLVIFLSQLIFSCNNSDRTNENDQQTLRNLVEAWNKAHNEKNQTQFSTLYGDSVIFYQQSLSRILCVERKLKLLNNQKAFYQQIVGEIEIESYGKGQKCSFVKKVTIDGQSVDYPSYLVFEYVDKNWVIINEGDMITDANLSTKSNPEKKNNQTAKYEIRIPADAVEGDYDGDGKKEFMWLLEPDFPEPGKEGESFGECIGKCQCQIVFSNSNLKPITVESCIGGSPINEGDLDNNGTDEIGLLPKWWTSCWRSYLVLTKGASSWQNFVEPITTHCDQWEAGVDVIEKSNQHKGYVVVRSMDMATFKIKEELVKVD
ncbi:MAG: hypothetical protein GC181_13445 [Bacteroidetes bacterium]|nr:hypothetical protein [Bacteroidota bacterium]